MKTLIALLILLACSCSCLNHAGIHKDDVGGKKEAQSHVEIREYRDFVLWVGADFPDEFQIEKLSEKQKQDYEECGLEHLQESAREGRAISQLMLAGYHFDYSKCYRKAIYWSERSAESGDIDGMKFLVNAYLKGKGVLVDHTEALKWIIIISVLGDEVSLAFVNKTRTEDHDLYEQGASRARTWINAHPNLFCAP